MNQNQRNDSADTYLDDVDLQVFKSSVHPVSPADALLRKGRPNRTLAQENGQSQGPAPVEAVNSARALSIAEADAIKAYRDLTPYRVTVVLESDGWHVDYQLKDPRSAGGGPHYVIDALAGAIVSKRYEQ